MLILLYLVAKRRRRNATKNVPNAIAAWNEDSTANMSLSNPGSAEGPSQIPSTWVSGLPPRIQALTMDSMTGFRRCVRTRVLVLPSCQARQPHHSPPLRRTGRSTAQTRSSVTLPPAAGATILGTSTRHCLHSPLSMASVGLNPVWMRSSRSKWTRLKDIRRSHSTTRL